MYIRSKASKKAHKDNCRYCQKIFEENKTEGIIIVKKNNKYIMEYCSDERILTREYNFI